MKAIAFLLIFVSTLAFGEAPSDIGIAGNNSLPKNVDLNQLPKPLPADIQLGKQTQFYQFLPQDLTDEKKTEALTLMRKLNDICPSCATGASPTGQVVRGANINATPPLFKGKYASECIDINEYIELKIKAAAYDQLKK